MIEKYPPDTIFHFYFTTKGYEDVFLRLHAYFDIKVHVDQANYQQMACISDPNIYDLGPLFVKPTDNKAMYEDNKTCITTELTRFRSCHPDCPCRTRDIPGVVHAKVAVAAPAATIAQKNAPLPLDVPVKQVTQSADFSGRDISVYEISEENRPPHAYQGEHHNLMNSQYIKSKDGTCLLPCHIRYSFSRHSSFKEIYNLIKTFRPKQVYPFDHGIPSTKRFRMKETFGDICTGDHIFRFDQERAYFELQTTGKVPVQNAIESGRTHSSSGKSSDGVAEFLWGLESQKESQKPSDSANAKSKETEEETGKAEKEVSIRESQEASKQASEGPSKEQPPAPDTANPMPTPPPTNERKAPAIKLPLYGNSQVRGVQKGWNVVEIHGMQNDTGVGVFMNTEANFKSPPPLSSRAAKPRPNAALTRNAKRATSNDSMSQDYGAVMEMLWAGPESQNSDANRSKRNISEVEKPQSQIPTNLLASKRHKSKDSTATKTRSTSSIRTHLPPSFNATPSRPPAKPTTSSLKVLKQIKPPNTQRRPSIAHRLTPQQKQQLLEKTLVRKIPPRVTKVGRKSVMLYVEDWKPGRALRRNAVEEQQAPN